MAMKYPFAVKSNGKWYAAGTNVPEEHEAPKTNETLTFIEPELPVSEKRTNRRGRKPAEK